MSWKEPKVEPSPGSFPVSGAEIKRPGPDLKELYLAVSSRANHHFQNIDVTSSPISAILGNCQPLPQQKVSKDCLFVYNNFIHWFQGLTISFQLNLRLGSLSPAPGPHHSTESYHSPWPACPVCSWPVSPATARCWAWPRPCPAPRTSPTPPPPSSPSRGSW